MTKAGATSTYAYDGMGRRVRKFTSSGASSTVLFVYDQNGQLLGEYDQSGAALREYVWLGSAPVAMFTPDPTPSNPPLVYFIHADHIDTPRIVVDRSNNLRWRWLAEPFGTMAPETNPASLGNFTLNLRFPGQYADSESGLSYNFFRDYDSSTGRYAQSDPIGLGGGINTYAYVGADPIRHSDPKGLIRWKGEQYQVTVAGAVGGSLSWFDLKSQCVNGKYAYVRVFASAVVAGLGAKATGAGGGVEFNDSNIEIDPDVFTGNYRFFSGGLGAGPVASYSYTQLGQAFSTPSLIPSTSLGYDVSFAASIFGRSAVASIDIKDCGCPQ